MEARCQGDLEIGKIRTGGSMRAPPSDGCLDNKRRMYQIFDPVELLGDLYGTWRCQVHRGCVHNEKTGLLGRVLGDVPAPTAQGLRMLRSGLARVRRWLLKKHQFTRHSYEDILAQYSGAKRTKYEAAAESLKHSPVERWDARVTLFVKGEKRNEDDLKDPRVIQFRTPRYNIELATYLRPIEHAFLRYKGCRRGLRRSYVIAKGRDSVERASLIAYKMQQFGDPVCVPLDAKRFDKHVAAEVLEEEHAVYNAVWNDKTLRALLSYQIRNKGKSMGGIKYKVVGNRMSGDYNTGLGNCLIMAAMVEEWLRGLKLVRFDYFADSDDCLVFIERTDLQQLLNGVDEAFLQYGQEVTVDEVAYELWDIKHCQAKPVATAGGVRMIRDWRKVVSQAFCGYSHYHDPVGGMRVAKSVAQCELVLNAGVPILQPMAQHMLHLLEPLKLAALDLRDKSSWLALIEAKRRHFDWTNDVSLPITEEARSSFERVFGLSKEEQIAIERRLQSLTLSDIDLSRRTQRFPDVDQWYY